MICHDQSEDNSVYGYNILHTYWHNWYQCTDNLILSTIAQFKMIKKKQTAIQFSHIGHISE